jgi:hypothetical protein
MSTLSLDELIKSLRSKEMQLTDEDTYNHTGKVPSYLFRGERKIYDTITSTEYRFKNSSTISSNVKDEILLIIKKCSKTMKECEYPIELMASLLQHYGFPTPIVDVTSSLDVAASFAAHNNRQKKGRILVYKMKELVTNCVVIDLSDDSIPAQRPRRQKGFTIFHEGYNGLSGEFDKIRPTIFEFQGIPSDIIKYDKNKYYCDDLKRDPVSGFLNDLIFRSVLDEKGYLDDIKISEETKICINNKVPWCEYPRSVKEDDKGNLATFPNFKNF